MQTRRQKLLLKVAAMADECQNIAYNYSYTEPNSDIGWWGLHETISLFHYYIIGNDDNYINIGRGLLEMIPEGYPEFAELVKGIKCLLKN
jgi:hypothetical protein